MAGLYPDVPGYRMAYDRDGSIGFSFHPDQDVSDDFEWDSSDLETINDEDTDSLAIKVRTGGGAYVGIIFPEPRDVDAWFLATSESWEPNQFEWSTDTTNGRDGTWTVETSGSAGSAGLVTGLPSEYRDADKQNNVSLTGASAVRWRSGSGTPTDVIEFLHLYGQPSSGEAADRLRFWHPTSDAEVDGAYFDWDDIARSTDATRDFRIKNPSATLTANSVSVTREALTDTTPSNVSQHTLSDDGGSTYASSLAIGNLGPGSTSSILTLKRDTEADATLSIWALRLIASASSYS